MAATYDDSPIALYTQQNDIVTFIHLDDLGN